MFLSTFPRKLLAIAVTAVLGLAFIVGLVALGGSPPADSNWTSDSGSSGRAPAVGRTETMVQNTEAWRELGTGFVDGEPRTCSVLVWYEELYQRNPGEEWNLVERKRMALAESCFPPYEPPRYPLE